MLLLLLLLYLAREDSGQAWKELLVHHNSVRPRFLPADHIAQGPERGCAKRVLQTQGGNRRKGEKMSYGRHENSRESAKMRKGTAKRKFCHGFQK